MKRFRATGSNLDTGTCQRYNRGKPKKKKGGGLVWRYPHANCSLELQSKEACLHQLHQNCPIYTHIRHPRFTNYNTDYKAKGNFAKLYHHVKHDGDIFPTFTLISDTALLHRGGNRHSQIIRFTCCSMKCH